MPFHPIQAAFQQLPAFPLGNFCIQFHTQAAVLDLFFQYDIGKIIVIIPNPELFPSGNAVYLLPQRLIFIIVKINTPYSVPAVGIRMRICPHHSFQAAFQLQILEIADHIFQLMAKMLLLHSCFLLSVLCRQNGCPALSAPGHRESITRLPKMYLK